MRVRIVAIGKGDAFYHDKDIIGLIGEFTTEFTRPGGFRAGSLAISKPLYEGDDCIYPFYSVKIHQLKEGEE